MSQIREQSVSSIVRNNYRTAGVFQRYGISYCCGGQSDLSSACRLRGLDPGQVEKELADSSRSALISGQLAFHRWKTEFLLDYVLNVHHAYLEETIPSLARQLASFTLGHQKKWPQFLQIEAVFEELAQLLREQLRQEEDVIFPYIRQLEKASGEKESYGSLFVRTLRKPLQQLETEHLSTVRLLDALQAAADRFSIPERACTNHQVILQRLREFHDDCRFHGYLEDEHLLPRARNLEAHLLDERG